MFLPRPELSFTKVSGSIVPGYEDELCNIYLIVCAFTYKSLLFDFFFFFSFLIFVFVGGRLFF